MSENAMAAGTLLAGRYEVGALLGAGGFGATYQARDRARFGATCVVKELLPMRQASETARRLFEREARLLADLSHPQIPKLDAYFEHDGRFILIQEYVEGETLAARLQRETRLPEAEVRQIVLQLLEVLGYLHARTPPVIHRDLKPANIILARDGRVFLIDFGAVREAIGRDETHTSIGTAGYTPLEQAAGRATPASDCYALGATALHMVSGMHPLDWHDRETGLLAFQGRLPCSPSFEAFLTGTLAELSKRVPDARAARNLLLGGATVAGDDSAAHHDALPPAEAAPTPLARGMSPATVVNESPPQRPALSVTAPVDSKGRVVPPARDRRTWRVVLPLVTLVGAAVGWIVLGDGGTKAAESRSPTAAQSDTGTTCAQPSTIVHRTESQFDLHILCPVGWSATYMPPLRTSRLAAPDRHTEVWAGLWRPLSSDERPEEFGERWRAAMAPHLGALTLQIDERADSSLVRYEVSAAAEGRVRGGSLQVERTHVGDNAYMTWSLSLGPSIGTDPMALQVLGSIDYRDPSASPTRDAVVPVR